MQIRGFGISIGGTYVLLDDVVTALHTYANSYHDPDDANVHEAATWLQAAIHAGPVDFPGEHVTEESQDVPVFGIVDDMVGQVDRIEIYPDDPEAKEPRWIARACDDTGRILRVTNGSFDQEYVIRDAQERWPDKPTHLVVDYSHDTVWEENDPGGLRSVHTKRRRPSPNRLWR